MAQVKKFQNPAGPLPAATASTPAGSPAQEPKKKYGKWIVDGIEYEMDDESMKNFAEHAKNVKNAKDRKFAAEYWKMLQNGEDVIIDSVTNESNVLPKWLGKRAKKKITKDVPQEGILASVFNTPQHQYNRTTAHMATFNPNLKKEAENSAKEVLSKWTKDAGFEYEAMDDGTHRFRDLVNTDNLEYFDKIAGYLEGTDEHRAKYDISGWSDMNNILSWYRNIKDETGEKPTGAVWMNNLRAAITNGSELTQDQKDYLNAIGLGHKFGTSAAVAEQNAKAELDSKKNTAWSKYNTDGLWSTSDREKYFNYDENSDSYSMNTDHLPGTLDSNAGYYFNDDFVTQFAGEGYDWLRGKIYLNGKWYSDADLANTQSNLYKILNNPTNDYFNKNKRGQYAEANKIMMTTWDGAHNLIPSKSEETSRYIGDFYSKPWLYEATNYMMKGTRYNGADLNDDYTIRRYVDLSDTNFLDHTGRRKYKWALTDAYGNVVDSDLDRTLLEGIYDWSTDENAQKITPYSRLSTDPNDKYYYNRYVKSTTDENGNTLIEGYFEPNNSKVHASISSELGGDGKNVFLDMPIEVYDVLSNKTFLSSLNARRDLKEKFVNLVGNKTRKGRQITIDELMSMNLTQDQATAIIEYFQTHWKDPKTIAKPVGRKHGGIIKAQSGAVVRHAGYNPAQALENATQLNETFVNPYESRVVRKDGEWDFWKDLTPTDKLEIAGLTADLTGMAVGFVPVVGDAANVALSTIGSNILYGIADRRRVKEGAAPKGTTWKNIAMGVGADVASLLPVAGDLANATRWGSRLKDFALKSEPFAKAFTTGLAAYGAIGAIDSYKKLMSGEDLTADEFRELIYGAMSVFGLAGNTKRAIGDAQVAAKTAPKPEALTRTTKFKKADGTEGKVTLDEGQIAKLTHFTAAGDKKSKEMLSQMLRDADVPAEEINRIMGDANALKELGLIREAPKVGVSRYTAVKQERTPGALEYWARPVKRTRDLQSRSTSDLFKAAESNPKAVARWVNANEGNASLKWSGDTERHHQSDAGTGVIKWGLYNDSAKWYPGTTSAELKARAEAETRAKENAKAEKLLEKAARADAAARAKLDANAEKQHKAELLARAESIAAAKKARAKLDANAEKQHKAELLARAKSIAAAKKAKANTQKQAEEVVVKANNEFLIEPVIETIPSFDFEGYRTRTTGKGSPSASEFKKRIGKEFDDKSFQEAVASNPAEARRILTEEIENWAKKQTDQTGIERRKQKLIREIEKMRERRNLVFRRGGVIKAKWGQQLRNFWEEAKLFVEPLVSDEARQGLLSGARYLLGNASTDRTAKRSIDAVRDSARIAQQGLMKEIYTPQIINAGNSEQAILNHKLKNLSAITNDPVLNLQMQKVNSDEIAMHRGNIARLNAQQNVENQIRGTEEKRMYAGLNHEITGNNNKIAASVPTIESEIENMADTAKTQSGLQYLYQIQQEWDQDRNEALAFAKTTLENDMRIKANEAFEAAESKYFTKDNPFNPSNNEHVTLLNNLYKQYNGMFTNDMKTAQFNMMSPGAQRYYTNYVAMKKSGGSMRSTADQIKINSRKAEDQIQINKHKAFDKNWVDSNKEIHKALGKMSDRVHDLIMKMLS